MSLDWIGQAADCEPESKSGRQHCSMTPALLQVLPCMSSCPDCYQWWNKPFLPQVPLVTVFFSAAQRSKGEQWLFSLLYKWMLSSVTPLLCLYHTIPHVDTSWGNCFQTVFTTGTLIQMKFHTMLRHVKCKKKICFGWRKGKIAPSFATLGSSTLCPFTCLESQKCSQSLLGLSRTSIMLPAKVHSLPFIMELESAGKGSGGPCLNNNLCNPQTHWTLSIEHGSPCQFPWDISLEETLLFLFEVSFFLSSLQKYSWNWNWYHSKSTNI